MGEREEGDRDGREKRWKERQGVREKDKKKDRSGRKRKRATEAERQGLERKREKKR